MDNTIADLVKNIEQVFDNEINSLLIEKENRISQFKKFAKSILKKGFTIATENNYIRIGNITSSNIKSLINYGYGNDFEIDLVCAGYPIYLIDISKLDEYPADDIAAIVKIKN